MASPVASANAAQDSVSRGKSKPALTPPTSEDWNKNEGSDLSDLDLDNSDDEIEPDHYWEGGEIPVFKPTMAQFHSFKDFVAKIDKYGMKSGIVKVIPPKEWTAALPPLDHAVKSIKVKNPITQEFSGTHGTYTQANIEKQRSYNLPQWKALTDESQHQPPARRGERRKNEKPVRGPNRPRTAAAVLPDDSATEKRKPGRPRKNPVQIVEMTSVNEQGDLNTAAAQRLPTPTSPEAIPKESDSSPKLNTKNVLLPQAKATAKRKQSKGSNAQPKSVSERRKYNRREVVDQIDENAFVDFNYRMLNKDEFTSERCAELETLYWKSLTFAPPMYGADMPGSLFDDSTTSWNVAKLENVLDVLGQNVPGVNTAYLYLGMWKATYAWHLEDVDLYSINYIHFGAPKQWYSISQEDARRFENAMKSIWPQDAKNCSQFLRHKTYLISPAVLQSQFNIRVNKLVHYEGEFVITFPYGYHSGYNLGYNCAESVNFATEAWLDYGKIAKKCDCEADSVWIDVEDIERKLRGESTPEYYDETDQDEDDSGELNNYSTDLPSPPASVVGKMKGSNHKRKRELPIASNQKVSKKLKIRLKSSRVEPCVLCPNDMIFEPVLQTDTGRYAHRVCALYTPETYMQEENGADIICGISNIDKARLDLKCSFCRSKKGACFQCSSKKCTRAFHATCAAAAGVQVDFGPIPVYGEDGTEYVSEAYDFRCRFHRAKRHKNTTSDLLESSDLIQEFARTLEPNHVIQVQYPQGDVFAGVVVENRLSECTVVLTVLPEGDQMEVEWKYILTLDPADSQLPRASAGAKPLPSHMDRKTMQSRNLEFGPPQADDLFSDARYPYKWAEFHTAPPFRNPAQVQVDLRKKTSLWHYLGDSSTEARAQYTDDPNVRLHNAAGNFLESVRPSATIKRQATNSSGVAGPSNPIPNESTDPARSQDHASSHARNAPRENSPWTEQTSWTTKAHQPNHRKQFVWYTPQYPYKANQTVASFNKPSGHSASSLARHVNINDLPGPASLTRSPLEVDLLRPVESIRSQETRNEIKQQLAQSGMLPLVDLLVRPSSPSIAQDPIHQEYLSHITQYPYLRNSYIRRPKTYQSPYKNSGGYSNVYTTTSSAGVGITVKGSSKLPRISSSLDHILAPQTDAPGLPNSTTTIYCEHPALSLYEHQPTQAFRQQTQPEAVSLTMDRTIYNKANPTVHQYSGFENIHGPTGVKGSYTKSVHGLSFTTPYVKEELG